MVLIAPSDEEANVSDVGMPWLARERPDIAFDRSLDEGGGIVLDLADGRRLVTVSVREKVVIGVRLHFHGRGGHASVRTRAVNGTQEPRNVIPPYADVICDCRALPGRGEDDVCARPRPRRDPR